MSPKRGGAGRAPRRRTAALSLVIPLLGVAGALGWTGHAAADAWNRRDAARAHLDAALTAALTDGVEPAALASVVAVERDLLGEPIAGPHLGLVAPGDASHALTQEQRLRALIPRVRQVEAVATSRAQAAARVVLVAYAAVIDRAAAAGLDPGPARAAASAAAREIAGATTPRQVSAAVGALSRASAELLDVTVKREAANAVAAAAAALERARAAAQQALQQAQQVVSGVAAFPQLSPAGLAPRLAEVQAAYAAARTAADFTSVAAAASTLSRDGTTLLAARAAAYGDLDSAQAELAGARAAGLPVWSIPEQLAPLRPQLEAAGTTAALRSIDEQIAAAMSPLLDRLGIDLPSTGKVIVISLGRQDLSAYQDGSPVLSTVVTTGRPQLPTPTGTTQVLSKNSPFQMISPWPRGSPYYYYPSWVTYTLWFREGGYAIHDAPWRSDYGGNSAAVDGTHGCVNVPLAVMKQLYPWAPPGTTVIVH